MSLEDQIAQTTNPQEFTRLCNILLTAEYGEAFQVIDGTRGDEGNDGYISSEKRVIAIYCPIKPERRTDADYVEKIRSDLKKADVLQKSGKYEIQKWTFITPRKLSNTVVSFLRRTANEFGFEGNHQEATYLATALGKHTHLAQQFPDLFIPKIDQKLNEILELLKGHPPIQEPVKDQIDKDHLYRAEPTNKDEFDQVISLRTNPATEDTRTALKIFYYKSTDPVVKLNALLGLLDLYDPLENTAEDMVTLCEEGLRTAQIANSVSARVYFNAQKGYFLSYIYSNLDMQTTFQIMADNAIGLPTITEAHRQAVIKKLEELEISYSSAFNESIELSKESGDLAALASVLVLIGTAAGQRALYLNTLGVGDRSAAERQRCKRALLTAKDIYGYLQDELGKANALFNLANQIRFFGDTKEALALVEDSVAVAAKHGDHRLLKKARWLKETLETGKIPDYLAGQRRE